MAKNVFDRYEKKYLLTKEQFKSLKEALNGKMEVDGYGLHTICNIYYDTDDFELIRKSIEKPVYKEKFRVRSYGVPKADSNLFLEIKKKYKGVVNKRRVELSVKEAKNYLEKDIKPGAQTQIFREVDYLLKRYDLSPKLFLSYDRIAMFGVEDSEFRVTFDQNIISRDYDLDLMKGVYGDTLIGRDQYLMEVKIDAAIPLWFANILSSLEIFPVNFSKYGTVYKSTLIYQANELVLKQVLSA